MTTLAHLSDIHLAPLPARPLRLLASQRILGFFNWHVLHRKKMHLRTTLDHLVADLKTRDADHVAVTGDLVNIALPKEFTAARAWLEALGPPDNVSLVPGNHDAYIDIAPPNGIASWNAWMQSNAGGHAFAPHNPGERHGTQLPYVRIIGTVALIGVSSAVATAPFMATGTLGPTQRDALVDILSHLGTRDFAKVLLIHHPPLPGVSVKGRDLTDADALTDILHRFQIDLALHGHNHTATINWGAGAKRPFPVIGVPSASMGFAGHKDLARYNLYDFARDAGGWSVRMRGFGFETPDGPVVQLEDTQLVAPADFMGEP